jgi:hypothetical protein
LLCGIDLSEVIGGIILGESLGGLGILGSQLLAVTTIKFIVNTYESKVRLGVYIV